MKTKVQHKRTKSELAITMWISSKLSNFQTFTLISTHQLPQYKARVDYYNGLVTTYDVERAAYDLKVKEANKYVDPWVKTF
jgi:hypothetical protein